MNGQECPTRVSLAVPPRLVRIGRARVPGEAHNEYQSDTFWAVHLYFGRGLFTVCRQEFDLEPGSITVSPCGETSVYRTADALDHIFVHLIVDEGGSPATQLPLHLAPDTRSAGIAKLLHEALRFGRETRSRAEAILWVALHELAACTRPGGVRDSRVDATEHPIVGRVMDFIELNLPNRITLAELAAHVEISPTHLNRMCTAVTGQSAMSYVRSRRMDLARYLLTGTSIPVKEIAYQVGVPDVHAFNKLCKRYLGEPPTRVRAMGEGRPRRVDGMEGGYRAHQ